MSSRILIAIEVPDGVTVDVRQVPADPVQAAQQVFSFELVELPPDQLPPPQEFQQPAVRTMAAQQPQYQQPVQQSVQQGPYPPIGSRGTLCPTHNQPWKWVPPGVTRSGPRAGQPYDGFMACPVRGCRERP